MEHKGGFLPFELELTELVVPGETLLLTVAADEQNHQPQHVSSGK